MGSGEIIITDAAKDYTAAIAGSGIFAGLASIWICAVVIVMLVGLFFLVIWIIALIDCAKRKPEEFPGDGENTKTIWLVILIATFFVGNLHGIAALVYYFMVMKKCPKINNNVKMN
jgi:hypothetical protein